MAEDVDPAVEAARLFAGQHGAAQLDEVQHALRGKVYTMVSISKREVQSS
jgi:hypothetical protein